ncbi:unnamed protein product [Ambrosiozyma monospora]|uniref:Unnamed protein product n=1 Tax=Ambrosiozyma monospora TaxID=43982 RepID=A0A9W6Z2T0_AMBMO|nr:unnamed protein product [Ambrosiozyma monospora]
MDLNRIKADIKFNEQEIYRAILDNIDGMQSIGSDLAGEEDLQQLLDDNLAKAWRFLISKKRQSKYERLQIDTLSAQQSSSSSSINGLGLLSSGNGFPAIHGHTTSPTSPTTNNGQNNKTDIFTLSHKQVLQRIEADRERQKKGKETTWQVKDKSKLFSEFNEVFEERYGKPWDGKNEDGVLVDELNLVYESCLNDYSGASMNTSTNPIKKTLTTPQASTIPEMPTTSSRATPTKPAASSKIVSGASDDSKTTRPIKSLPTSNARVVTSKSQTTPLSAPVAAISTTTSSSNGQSITRKSDMNTRQKSFTSASSQSRQEIERERARRHAEVRERDRAREVKDKYRDTKDTRTKEREREGGHSRDRDIDKRDRDKVRDRERGKEVSSHRDRDYDYDDYRDTYRDDRDYTRYTRYDRYDDGYVDRYTDGYDDHYDDSYDRYDGDDYNYKGYNGSSATPYKKYRPSRR